MKKNYYEVEKTYKPKKQKELFLYLIDKGFGSVCAYRVVYKSFLTYQRWLKYLDDDEILKYLDVREV